MKFSPNCRVLSATTVLWLLVVIGPTVWSQIRLGNLKAEAAKIKNRIETASDVAVKQIKADVELQVSQTNNALQPHLCYYRYSYHVSRACLTYLCTIHTLVIYLTRALNSPVPVTTTVANS